MTACPAVLVCGAGKPWAGMGKWQGLSFVFDYECYYKPESISLPLSSSDNYLEITSLSSEQRCLILLQNFTLK